MQLFCILSILKRKLYVSFVIFKHLKLCIHAALHFGAFTQIYVAS